MEIGNKEKNQCAKKRVQIAQRVETGGEPLGLWNQLWWYIHMLSKLLILETLIQ